MISDRILQKCDPNCLGISKNLNILRWGNAFVLLIKIKFLLIFAFSKVVLSGMFV